MHPIHVVHLVVLSYAVVRIVNVFNTPQNQRNLLVAATLSDLMNAFITRRDLIKTENETCQHDKNPHVVKSHKTFPPQTDLQRLISVCAKPTCSHTSKSLYSSSFCPIKCSPRLFSLPSALLWLLPRLWTLPTTLSTTILPISSSTSLLLSLSPEEPPSCPSWPA